jgi:hypothetical protein
MVWLFLALLLLSARLRAISSTLHLRMLPAHFLLLMLSAHLLLMMLCTHLLLMMLCTHLWIARHLILHVRLASRTSGSAHVAGVHLGLVSPHGPPVALISCLMLVSALSCSTVTCSRALPIILFSNLFATGSRFACSGFPSASVEITFVYVPICVSSFSSSRSLALALA